MAGIKFSFFPNVFLTKFKVKDDPGKIKIITCNVFVYLTNSLGSSRTSPIQKMVLFTEVTLHSTLLLTFGPKLFFFISSTSLEVLFHFQNMFEAWLTLSKNNEGPHLSTWSRLKNFVGDQISFTLTEKSSMTEIALKSKLLVPQCQNRSKSSREAGFGATEMWQTPSSPPTLTLRDPLPPTEHPIRQWSLFYTEEFWFKFELQFKRGLNHVKKSWFKFVSCLCKVI